jgi:hypothetical protein
LIIQNASGAPINFDILFFDGKTGAALTTATKNVPALAPNASFEFDLETHTALGENWYGSAVVHSNTSGGLVAVVTNLFNGPHAMQTFNGFTTFGTKWGIPLFMSRLALRGTNTPLVIQNRSGNPIAVDGITLTCTKDASSPGQPNFTIKNSTAIPDKAAYFDFNPVSGPFAATIPDDWFGSCTLDSGAANTALFIQNRTVDPEGTTTFTGKGDFRAGAYEGIRLDGTSKHLMVPLFARRLAVGFASNVTIQNIGNTATDITLKYKGSPLLDPAKGEPSQAQCTVTVVKTGVPAGGAVLQNHRVVDAVPNSTPSIPEKCYGTIEVTSSATPIDGYVQLDLPDDLSTPPTGQVRGDPFQAHNVFLLPN